MEEYPVCLCFRQKYAMPIGTDRDGRKRLIGQVGPGCRDAPGFEPYMFGGSQQFTLCERPSGFSELMPQLCTVGRQPVKSR